MCLQNTSLHSCCVHIRPWCARPTDAIIMDVHLTISELYALLSDMMAHYATNTHPYPMAANFYVKNMFCPKRRNQHSKNFSYDQVSNLAPNAHQLIPSHWVSSRMLHVMPTTSAASFHNFTYSTCLIQPPVWMEDFHPRYPSKEKNYMIKINIVTLAKYRL